MRIPITKRTGAPLLTAGLALVAGLLSTASASAATDSFAYTGAPKNWTVPPGVTAVTVKLSGAQGSDSRDGAGGLGTPGGKGATLVAVLPVTPGQVLELRVGGLGAQHMPFDGGYNGGGATPTDCCAVNNTIPGPGGGASDIRIGGSALADRVLVAAGGGGGGGRGGIADHPAFHGGAGGASATQGERGADDIGDAGFGGAGGTPGTAIGGGVVGGALGQGGAGAGGEFGPGGAYGGGGGGGLYGGGGGAQGFGEEGGPITSIGGGGGGGGGWSYTAPSATFVSLQNGDRSRAGQIDLTYAVPDFKLRIQPAGAGAGAGFIGSEPAGLECGQNEPDRTVCAADFADGTAVKLTPYPAPGNEFAGFSGGGCIGTDPCTVTMDQARTIGATFEPAQRTLEVQTAGAGGGWVTSAPVGVDCGRSEPGHMDCSAAFATGSLVTLTPHAGADSRFAGFSGGGCAGTAPCIVSMEVARTVHAEFAKADRTLAVVPIGAGAGVVDSNPVGIDCGLRSVGHHTCSAAWVDGARVTLTAEAHAGSRFEGFSGGGCAGTAPCTVALVTARTVSANFAPALVPAPGPGPVMPPARVAPRCSIRPTGNAGALTVRARCNAAATVALRGTATIRYRSRGRNRSRRVALHTVTTRLRANRTTSLRVTLPRSVRVAAGRHQRVGIAFSLAARAPSGARSTRQATVRTLKATPRKRR